LDNKSRTDTDGDAGYEDPNLVKAQIGVGRFEGIEVEVRPPGLSSMRRVGVGQLEGGGGWRRR
jgi:hypothetical protein